MKVIMLKAYFLGLALLCTAPLLAQVEPSATGGVSASDDDSQMMVPPPLSGRAYPVAVGSEARSNYLSGGLVFTTAHNDNVLTGQNSAPVSDETYAIEPTIMLERKIPRQMETFSYSAGFTFYQKLSVLNAVNQNAAVDYEYRLTRHATVEVQDSFSQNSNAFNSANPFVVGGVSGSPDAPNNPVIAPFASQIFNATSGRIGYQFSRSAMVGASGSYSLLHYGDGTQYSGLFNSDSKSGSGFLNRRLGGQQYIGLIYQYSNTQTHPVETFTTTHTIFGFYTIYVKRVLSFSVVGGPQHFDSTQVNAPPATNWTPAISGSMGLQGRRTSLSANYSRVVSGGGGLLGAYHSNNAGLSARWLIAKNWDAGVSGEYSIYKSVSPVPTAFNQGGHTISGTASVQHLIGEHFNIQGGYSRLHQNYSGIAEVFRAPDSNREFISVSYQFSRPLGR